VILFFSLERPLWGCLAGQIGPYGPDGGGGDILVSKVESE